MNIFFLADEPRRCAINHCDKHVVKMILEYAQLLSTAVELTTGTGLGYKKTHENHPCSVWVRESAANFWWLFNMATYLTREYNFRYNKDHKSAEIIQRAGAYTQFFPGYSEYKIQDFSTAPQCMPERYRSNSLFYSYQVYYIAEKLRFAKWKMDGPPPWTLDLKWMRPETKELLGID